MPSPGGPASACTICSLSAITGLPTDTWPNDEYIWEYTKYECGGIAELGTELFWGLCDIAEFPERYGSGVYLIALFHPIQRRLELEEQGLPATGHCVALEVRTDGSAFFVDNTYRAPIDLDFYVRSTSTPWSSMPRFADHTHRISRATLDSPELRHACTRYGARVQAESDARAYRLIEQHGSIAAAAGKSLFASRDTLRTRARRHADTAGLPLPWRTRTK